MHEHDDNCELPEDFDPTDMIHGVALFANALESIPPEARIEMAAAILEKAFLSVKFDRREVTFQESEYGEEETGESVFCTVEAPANIFFAIMLAGAALTADEGYVSGMGDFREVVMHEGERPELAAKAMLASGALLHGLFLKISSERNEFLAKEQGSILEQFKALLDELPTAEKDEN